jgi:methoxymalonate biosynthesis acyl carrier protein
VTTPAEVAGTAESIADELLRFLKARVGADAAPDLDLFASGLVTSLFAMELVVHLEKSFDVVVAGADLQMDNFRTVDAMTALVLRLRQEPAE